jgi:predicted amidohydrolase
MRVPVVVGQLPITWTPDRNRDEIVSFLDHATRPGDLVVLPEGALSGYDDALSGLGDLDPAELAAAADAVAAAVRQRGVHLLCGSLLPDGGAWRNAAIYFAPDGRRWVYHKVNLATHERGRLAPGSTLSVLPIPVGSGCVRTGVQLCREIRFPEQWHVLARGGAQVFTYLTCAVNPREPAGVWRSHLVSRAAETQRFVVAANVAHPDQHCPSMVISPRGEVLAEMSTRGPASVRVELDLGEVRDRYVSQQRADVVALVQMTS